MKIVINNSPLLKIKKWDEYKKNLHRLNPITFPVKIDERSLFSLMPVTPDTIDEWLKDVPQIIESIPEQITNRLNRILRIFKLTPFDYELHQVLIEYALLTYEMALRYAFWINLEPKGNNKTVNISKNEEIKKARDAMELFEHLSKGWKLEGKTKCKGSFSELSKWAFEEKKISEDKFKKLNPIWQLRHYGAHPMHTSIYGSCVSEIKDIIDFCNELFQ